MAATYTPIATTTLANDSSASFSFSSIPGTYTDLRLLITCKSTSSTPVVFITLNGNANAVYSRTQMYGDGASALSGRSTSDNFVLGSYMNTSTPTTSVTDIFNYTDNKYKTCLTQTYEDKNGSGGVYSRVTLYRSTSAITSITITAQSGAPSFYFATGTTAALYGILKA